MTAKKFIHILSTLNQKHFNMTDTAKKIPKISAFKALLIFHIFQSP